MGQSEASEELWAGIEWSVVSRVAEALAFGQSILSIRDGRGMTPMLLAISRARSAEGVLIAQMLHEAGGSLDGEDLKGWGAAEWAANCGCLALEWVMARGVCMDEPSKDRAMTPFLLAAEFGLFDCAQWLVRTAGANKDAIGEDGFGAMHIAAQEGHVPTGKALFELALDIDARDSEGRTPLIIALKNQNLRFGRWLLDQGADVCHRSNDGLCAIDWAEKFVSTRGILLPAIAERARAQEERRELSALIDPSSGRGGRRGL